MTATDIKGLECQRPVNLLCLRSASLTRKAYGDIWDGVLRCWRPAECNPTSRGHSSTAVTRPALVDMSAERRFEGIPTTGAFIGIVSARDKVFLDGFRDLIWADVLNFVHFEVCLVGSEREGRQTLDSGVKLRKRGRRMLKEAGSRCLRRSDSRRKGQ